MSPDLDGLLSRLTPATPDNLELRLRFGLCCCDRVEHLLEDPEVLACLLAFRQLMALPGGFEGHVLLGAKAAALANAHPGSRSLDGVGHAAVSASYACAAAMSGKSRQAAEYAAYAVVYGLGGYGSAQQTEAFEPEFAWLGAQLQALLRARDVGNGAA